MIPDIDIWRSANVMVKRYGEDAALEAAWRLAKFRSPADVGKVSPFKPSSQTR